MIQPKFSFEVSKEATEKNLTLLLENNFDLHSLLNEHRGTSVTSYGSEFKSPHELEALFYRHPRWPQLKNIISKGSNWQLEKVNDFTRREDVRLAISRGNHKSAVTHHDVLESAIKKEIERGWILMLPKDCARFIPNLMISPMGVAEQLGVSSSGEFIPKQRITHDLSFPGQVSNESVN